MAHILASVAGAEVDHVPIRRALLSVSDKAGLIELARLLASFNVELLSTGGTAKAMRDAGLTVIDVSDYTGSPEILDGRVKTLHPKVHGGLLGVRGNPKHEEEMRANGIGNIDLVVMNLYPFQATGNDDALVPNQYDVLSDPCLCDQWRRERATTCVSRTSTSVGRRCCVRRPKIIGTFPYSVIPASTRPLRRSCRHNRVPYR